MPPPRESSTVVPGTPPSVFGIPSLLLLALAVAWHAAPFSWPTNRFDTGIQLCGADLVAAHRTPYVDFQTLYTPGAYYVKAAAFAVFGRGFDVHSYVDFVWMGVAAWAAWHLAARLTGGRLRALLAFAAGLAFSYPYPAVVLAMLAILVAARPHDRSPTRRAIFAGVVAGIAGWFRQDFGAVAALAAAATVMTAESHASLARRLALGVSVGVAAAATLALLLAPSLAASPHNVWQGLVVNPLATVGFRDESHGFVSSAPWHFLVIAAIAALLGALGVGMLLFPRSLAERLHRHADPAVFVGTAVLALWSLRYVMLRAEAHHLVPVALTAATLAGVSFRGGCAALLPTIASVTACAAAVVVPLAHQAYARLAEWTGRRSSGLSSLGETLPSADTFHLPSREAEDWSAVVASLRDLRRKGVTVLSACARHDRIHDQDLVLYFAIEQLPPVFDYHFDPGVTTRDDVQRGIIADAERAQVGAVVLYDAKDRAAPPTVLSPLDQWIAATFRAPGVRIGRYEIRVR